MLHKKRRLRDGNLTRRQTKHLYLIIHPRRDGCQMDISTAYRVQECKEYCDCDMVRGYLEQIPRCAASEIFERIKNFAIDILPEYDLLDPLYDGVADNQRWDALENDDAYVDACELEMDARREGGVLR